MFRRTALLTLTTLLTLSACSGDEETDTQSPDPVTTTDPAVQEPVDYECTDPLAGDPQTVEVYDLLVCTTLSLAETDGYVTTSTVGETESTVLRVNTDPFIVEVTYPDESVIIANATEAWVNDGSGEWQEGDLTSADYLIAQAPMVFETYRNSHDPMFTTAGIPEGTTYDVEGTEVIDGVEYHVLTAQFEEGGSTSDLRMWVGPDYEQYRVLMTVHSPDAEPLLVDSVYSEWDTPQDITLPN